MNRQEVMQFLVCRFIIIAVVLMVFGASGVCAADWDVQSDAWVATDALGRQLPGYRECGPTRQDRTVGIFYFLWLGQHGTSGPYDITKILAANPEDPQYGPVHAFHHWGESELGYYLSDDSYVIRRHCNLLVDAGVDVIVLDVTNGFSYTSNYMKVCSVYQQIRDEGGRTPQICFLLNPDNNGLVQTLYNELYSQNLYPDLWFRLLGKPLILAKPDGLTPSLQSFFTFRKCWAWSSSWWFPGTSAQHLWTWLDNYPQGFGYDIPGIPEELSVTVAQHATTNIGRSYHNGAQPPADQYKLCATAGEGLCFAEQWSRVAGNPPGSAPQIDPQFVFVTGWNEWTAMRFLSDGTASFLGETLPAGETYFVDTYNQEYSRDIEPMKGGHTDNYYYQMVSSIRRYKGVKPPEPPSASKTIAINGDFTQWNDVTPEFRDHVGDKVNRDYPGWGSAGRYVNKTGRNDIVASKVTYDADYIYFYVQTKDNITPYTGSRWMWLLIDSDCTTATGWHGYDFIVNQSVVNSTTTTIQRNDGGWNWATVRNISYILSGNKLHLRVPRADVGQNGRPDVKLDFKWMDNAQKDDDITEFFINGDCAPERRFNYRYDVSPSRIAGLSAVPRQEGIELNWTNPADPDLAGVIIRYSTISHPSSPIDGQLLCDRAAIPGSSDSFVHTGLDNIAYYYTAFSYDHAPLHTPAYASATPLCPAGFRESFDAYTEGALGGQGGWTTSGVASAQVQSLVTKDGVGKACLMDPVAAGYSIGNQLSFEPKVRGYYYVDLDARQDSVGGLSTSIVGHVNIYSSDSSTDIMRVRLQKDKVVVYPATVTSYPIQEGSWCHIRIGINIAARTFDVWFDGSKEIEDYPWNGTGTDIAGIGMVSSRNMSFSTQQTYIDNLSLQPRPPSLLEVQDDGEHSPSLSTLRFSFDPVACGQTYRYCVGTTPGALDVKGWTGCASGDVVVPDLSLIEGQHYFIGVQAGNAEGVWSSTTASDGISIAFGATIPEVKTLSDGVMRALRGKVVSAVFPDHFYVQEPDEPFGLKITSTGPAEPGHLVDVAGVTGGSHAERYLDASGIPLFSVASGGTGPAPVAMACASVGGASLGQFSPGVIGGLGPNNTGLYIMLWGKASNPGLDSFLLSDGSSQAVTVIAPASVVPQDGSYVLVKGISSVGEDREPKVVAMPEGGVTILKHP